MSIFSLVRYKIFIIQLIKNMKKLLKTIYFI